jgi:NADP-dependent 3-hydroxy acid dehydrogenase YdfG
MKPRRPPGILALRIPGSSDPCSSGLHGVTVLAMTKRTALITGASSGIGAATGRTLARAGHDVILTARRADRLRALADELGPNTRALPVDVADPEAVATLAAEAGPAVDLVVANAGVMLPGPIEAGDIGEWRRMLDANLVGLLATVRAFLPGLLAHAADGRGADLVVTSSLAARVAFPGYAVYTATKAAATALTGAIRTEIAGRGVRVTNVEPGLTTTELGDHITDRDHRAGLEAMFEQIPALTAEDVAEVIAFAATRPAHVNLRHLEVLPTRQV